MDLRRLEVFEAIMRSGSVSAVARELGLTQSEVSRLLARLEAQLGARSLRGSTAGCHRRATPMGPCRTRRAF